MFGKFELQFFAGDFMTLTDLARVTENKKVAEVIEIMKETDEMINDVPFVECNDGTGHISTQRTGLPEPSWRGINEGVPATKGTTAQQRDTTGLIEDYSDVDLQLAQLSNDIGKLRAEEDSAHIQGMNHSFARTLLYGDVRLDADKKKFHGLTPRFMVPSDDDKKPGSHILDGGGTGSDNTSIWLINWGPQTVHGIYPKGTTAGLQYQNLGQVTAVDDEGKMHEVYRSWYKWNCGIAVRDWRNIVRIANVDVKKLASGEGAADLIRLLVIGSEIMQNDASGRPVMYCNKSVRTFLRLQTLAKANVNLDFDTVEGKRIMTFDEMPVRRMDALLSTEAAVPFS